MKKCIIGFIFLALAIPVIAQQNIQSWKVTDLERYIQDDSADVLVINFWATFCKPCVAEIPNFIQVTDRYKDQGVKLLLVSLDLPSYYPEKIQQFAEKHQFNAAIVWLEETDADYFCPQIDESWSGAIPATLILNTANGYRKFIEGEIEANDFEIEIKKALTPKE